MTAFPFDAVLFDLDGTLVDSYDAIRQSVNHVREHHGLEPVDAKTVRSTVGNGLVRLLEVLAPVGTSEANVTLFHEHHPSVLAEGTHVLPGAREVLAELVRRGIFRAICSNKPVRFCHDVLASVNLAEFVPVVLGPESVARRKPAPDMLLEAVRRARPTPSRPLYVGDMTIDIETARAAGMEVWVVPTGSHSRETLAAASPDRILDGLSELLSDP